MRIIALPLRINASRSVPTFYSFRITAPPPRPPPPRTILTRWMPEEGFSKWAEKTWAAFGTAEKGTLKQRAFTLGERLMDRLDFEESNLKTLDLSMAPPPLDARSIPLLYPPKAISGPQSLDNLRTLVKDRIPVHQRGILTYVFFAILSAPLKLIPIIPNFPFYFCAWRTWSHWKAMRAARYIHGLLENNRIVPEPYKALDALYEGATLTHETLEHAVRLLDMGVEEQKELSRAHEQVLARVDKDK
ncbi:mitochondrial K+-H+ exchange-related-domain-containing protein [Roridomyces roridus]|uniref:Mitochondrial K+-H+ exchange-related-domain-containing protein n=1 Tax=Roridomyces roridus TaxID=1738132 RepID=A0AAD7C5P0_9AGAR|nr:mitochondrial K+-H+ exchange-related-domain-containing protein [Roridomyces roridus]